MYKQNPLEELLYGDTQGKKTFSQFRKGRNTEIRDSSVEEEKTRDTQKGTGTLERMGKSYKRRKRERKIQKLSDNPNHWKGLE